MSDVTVGAGYDQYTWSEKGSIYTSGDRARDAADVAFRMINIIKNAQKRGSFSHPLKSPYDIETLIQSWEEIGTTLRSPQYHELIAWHWLSTRSAENASQKPSEILLAALNRLRNAVYSDNMARIEALNAAEGAMLTFVAAYRAKLGASDKAISDRWLRGWKAKSSAAVQAGPGE